MFAMAEPCFVSAISTLREVIYAIGTFWRAW